MKAIVISAAMAIATLGSASVARDGRVDRVSAGKQVYERNCAACHGPGPGFPPFARLPGTEALQVKYNGDLPALLTERRDLVPDVIAYFVRNGVSVMPAYRKTEISDAELSNLGAYLSRNNPELKSRRGRE